MVYPRTGGGNAFTSTKSASSRGLSPHGRGKPGQLLGRGFPLGSIPARAGETGSMRVTFCLTTVYPRTGGGNNESRQSPPHI